MYPTTKRGQSGRAGGARRRGRAVSCALVAGLLALAAAPAAAGGAAVEGLRTSTTDERERFVFELDRPVQHEIFTLGEPHRIVIDIEDARLPRALPEVAGDSSLVGGIRSAPRNGDDLRVVLDLEGPGQPRSFLLQPAGDYGHRLVVDVVAPQADGGGGDARPAQRPRDLVIAIDPGHGGRDPGAVGRHGGLEKDIVLSVARRLHALLEDTPGFRPVMTRDGDEFLSLAERIGRAREARADLFVSIHADAFRNAHARGSSVYTLSVNGASSEAAKWLANRENAADLLGGVSLEDKDEMVASVLLDLSQTATIESSLNVGEKVLERLGGVNRLHRDSVQQAGFMVLKSPDIPSILVETAFISNPHEERNLRSAGHQQQLAEAIRDGIRAYFDQQAPPGTRVYAENRASSG